MKVTLFPTLTSTLRDAEEKTIDWRGLQVLLQHQYDPSILQKRDVPLFHPGSFRKGEKDRANKNVAHIYLGVLDFDAVTEDDLQTLVDRVDSTDLRSIIYTTWSNAKSVADDGLLKLRLVIPFNRAVEPYEWAAVWGGLVARYGHLPEGSVCDSSCKDLARFYYLPYLEGLPEERPTDAVLVSHGFPLDVDDLKDEVRANAPKETKPSGSKDIAGLTLANLKPLIKRLKKSADPTHVTLVGWCEKLLGGKELKFTENEGHGSWLLLTKCLAEDFPTVPAEQLFQVFLKEALVKENQRVDAEEQARHSEIVRLLTGAQSKYLDAVEEAKKLALDETVQRCNDLGLKGPYTKEQVEKFAEDMGVNVVTFRRHLIFQAGQTYYVFLNGKYITLSKDAAPVGLCQALLPAAEALNLNLHKVDKQLGVTRRTPAELVAEYGQSCYAIQFSTHLQQYRIDPSNQVLHAPLFPHPVIVPEKSELVTGWFDACCADETPEKRKMLDRWVGWATDLSMPLSLLLLVGPPDTGKSLFAQALATYWNRPCATAEIVFDTFSGEDLCDSPVIFADEYFPGDKTMKLRSILSMKQHRLNRKYQQVATVLGHYRLVVTANNDSTLLGMQKQALNPDDLLAVAKRVFYLKLSEKAAEYLNKVGTERIKHMLESGEFARHAAYLKEQARFTQPARFGTRPDQHLMDKVTIEGGVPSTLMRWIVKYLVRIPKAEKCKHISMFKVQGGKVALRLNVFETLWETSMLSMHEKLPEFEELRKAFDTITVPRRGPGKVIWNAENPEASQVVTYRELRMDLLEQWLDSHDTYEDPNAVRAALEIDTRDTRNDDP